MTVLFYLRKSQHMLYFSFQIITEVMLNVEGTITNLGDILPLVNWQELIGVLEPWQVVHPYKVDWNRAETKNNTVWWLRTGSAGANTLRTNTRIHASTNICVHAHTHTNKDCECKQKVYLANMYFTVSFCLLSALGPVISNSMYINTANWVAKRSDML